MICRDSQGRDKLRRQHLQDHGLDKGERAGRVHSEENTQSRKDSEGGGGGEGTSE